MWSGTGSPPRPPGPPVPGGDRRFVAAPRKGPVPDATRDRIRRLLGERVGLRAIARVTGGSRSWLPGFVNGVLREDTVDEPRAAPEQSGRLVAEADERWGFVGGERGVWRVWVALGAATRPVVGMVAGDRAEGTARRLWAAAPVLDRDGAVVYTDVRARYRAVLPGPSPGRPGGGREDQPRRAVRVYPRATARPVRPQDVVVLRVPAQPRRGPLVFRPLVQCIPTVGPLPA